MNYNQQTFRKTFLKLGSVKQSAASHYTSTNPWFFRQCQIMLRNRYQNSYHWRTKYWPI